MLLVETFQLWRRNLISLRYVRETSLNKKQPLNIQKWRKAMKYHLSPTAAVKVALQELNLLVGKVAFCYHPRRVKHGSRNR
jgi:hypothetical protein